jgi:hypothetical protein
VFHIIPLIMTNFSVTNLNDDPCAFKILNIHDFIINSIKDDNSLQFMNMQNKLIYETKKFCRLKINIHSIDKGKRSKLLGQ